ncbi:ABC transporter ATP-binding protein [Sorangium atrum]|uniref:ATP-binding cassette domain-containing protein n=1 Tax=Sorangium atrum TaxID=2995308 RepID=A0ABT5C5U0_9BACT|nr:ATP-binding cassette domain-containing protein [Sorangium aterium]MDC0681791.1 ATP-binding cassette domain-containing protein [Sorangium aterium]
MRIEIERVAKRFGPVKANDGVSLTIQAGAVHGLLGENGAGKSTLLRILGGLVRPDAGRLLFDGRPVALASPADALAAGVGVLHQEPLDFPPLTVLESYLVARPRAAGAGGGARSLLSGHGRAAGVFLPRRAAREELLALAARFGFSVDPDEHVARLTLGERQQIELLRLLSLGVRALLLDEPTTGISGAQQEALFSALRRLKADGKAIVLVSHKLSDVEALCDRVTVLRHGKVAGEAEMPAGADRLVALMFGEALASQERSPEAGSGGAALAPLERLPEPSPEPSGGDALALEGVAFGDHRLNVHIARLAVRRGEVIGLAGLEGSGQRLLLRACAGLLRARRGRVVVGGADLTGRPYPAFLRAGVGYLPADRRREGLIAGLSIEEHVALRAPRRGLFLRPREIRRAAERAIEALRIRGRPDTPVERLSGGNQQRTQLALLPADLALLLLEQPTRGLDIASARWVWEQLLARCRAGAALLFASSDLDELMRYSDRVLVFSGGRVSPPVGAADLTLDRLGRMIGGELDDAALPSALAAPAPPPAPAGSDR